MAIDSKVGEVLGLAKEGVGAVFWSAVALFLDGLFWRIILFLGRVFRFLAQLMETFYVVARAPAPFEELPPPLEPVHLPEESFVKPEGALGLRLGDPGTLGENRASRKKLEQGFQEFGDILPTTVQQPHFGPGIRSRSTVHEYMVPSAPLDPKLELYIPCFCCDIYCHRLWKKYYAVVIGRQPDIYNCWECAKLQVDGYNGQEHKSFPALVAAEEHFQV